MPESSLPPIYALLGDQEVLVRWPWYRPEPQVGDTVRLPIAAGSRHEWQTFRVVGKRVRVLDERGGMPSPAVTVLYLDVEPIVQ